MELLLIKNINKRLAPKALMQLVKKTPHKGSFKRGFNSWSEASAHTTTYNTSDVFNKTLNAARLVRDGKAVYERDSVVFNKIQYDFKVLSSLMFIANIQNQLNVVDFGGALGTLYRQNKKYLDLLQLPKKWAIVEQSKYVQIGKDEFQTDTLFFFEALTQIKFEVDIVLFGSSLCYIENAYEILGEIKKVSPKFILIYKTPFSNSTDDDIWIQNVPKFIYDASYPVWIFSKSKMLTYLSDSYELFEEWDDDLQAYEDVPTKGFLFKKKSN